VEYGAAPDGPQLVPAINRVIRRTGRVPRAVTADRGYGRAAVERDLHELGVQTVAIPRQGTTSPAGKPSSMPAVSAGWSSGGPGAKAGSATSSAATAGTGPSWTARTAPPSGAGMGYSLTTWSRSAPWPPNPQPKASRPHRGHHSNQALRLFQVEVTRRQHNGLDLRGAGPECQTAASTHNWADIVCRATLEL
jgi:hypothetical protein